MERCPHQKLTGRKVECSLGVFGPNPHIGVCRSCWSYRKQHGKYPGATPTPQSLRACRFREERPLKRPCGMSKKLWCVKEKPHVPVTPAMCRHCQATSRGVETGAE